MEQGKKSRESKVESPWGAALTAARKLHRTLDEIERQLILEQRNPLEDILGAFAKGKHESGRAGR
jgi:hypothetical protein